MNINILSDKIGWFGKYSGYECLPEYFPKEVDVKINKTTLDFYNKLIGKYYKVKNKWNFRSEDISNEIRFINKIASSATSHILYLENHLHLIAKVNKCKNRLIGTIHLPISQWNQDRLEALSALENVILLYDEEVDQFAKYILPDNIHVIKHGVDVDYFKPGDPAAINKNKVLFVGHFLRNFEMMFEVYEMIRKNVNSNLEYHFIIPAQFRTNKFLQLMAGQHDVFFHEKLSDDELLQQYQTSYALIMPMQDSGANTAIVQALAVGLPIITTDVGGIRSYGGDTIFPVVQNGDVIAMTELVSKFLQNENFRNEISKKQRTFTVEHLDWNLISQQHLQLYKQLILHSKAGVAIYC